MLARRVSIIIFIFVSVLAGALFAEESAPTFTAVDLALVDLETPVRIGGVEYCQVYLVRLHGRLPVPGARLLRLYLGDEPIGEYGDFPGGLYFYVPEKSRLAELNGRAFRWRWDDGPLHDAHVGLNASGVEALTPLPEKEALTR